MAQRQVRGGSYTGPRSEPGGQNTPRAGRVVSALGSYGALESRFVQQVEGLDVPTNAVAPVITGGVVGETASCSQGSWGGNPSLFTYQWFSGASPIIGATLSTYLIAAGDLGQSLSCQVTATNVMGATTQASAAVLAVSPPDETTIDNFNRADGLINVGAPQWSANALETSAATAMAVVSNQLTGASPNGSAYLVDGFRSDCDLVVDVPTPSLNSISLYLGASNPGPSYSGYVFLYFVNITVESWVLRRVAAGVVSNLSAILTPGAPGSAAAALGITQSGASFWLARRGATLTLYRKQPGGVWVNVLSATDPSPITSGGINGIGISGSTNRLDNLRGGPLAITPYDLVIDVDNPVSHWKLGEGGSSSAVDRKHKLDLLASNQGGTGSATSDTGLVLANDSNPATRMQDAQVFTPASTVYTFYTSPVWSCELWLKANVLVNSTPVQKPVVIDRISVNSTGTLTIGATDASGVFRFYNSTNQITTGQTYHIVGTFDGSTLRLYVNGVLWVSGACVGLLDADRGIQIGNVTNNSNVPDLVIDEVAWYNSTLSQARIQAHYLAGGTQPVAAAAASAVSSASGALTIPGGPYRSFNGSSDSIYTGGGAIGTPGSSAFTLLMLVKPTTLFFGIPMSLYDTVSAQTLMQVAFNGTNDWRVEHAFGAPNTSTLPLNNTDWQLVAVSKAASGASAIRYHRAVLGAAWAHEAGGSTLGPTNACDRVLFGRGTGGNFQAMGLAVAAVWNRGLSDAEIDSINDATADMQALSGLVALWQFNQASVSTVSDLTGGGADQTAISGTSAVAGEPSWAFATAAAGVTLAASAASAASSASALVSAPAPLTGSASAVASEAATLIVRPTVVANASSAVASTSATVSAPAPLTGSASALASTSAILSARAPLTGSASAVASASAVVSAPAPLTGSASASASESATLIVRPTVVANASSAIASTSALLSAPAPLAASASASGSATATLTVAPTVVAATASAAASASAVVSAPQPLIASASASASGSATLLVVPTVVLDAASAVASSSALLSAPQPLTATASAIASVAGTPTVALTVVAAAASATASASATLIVRSIVDAQAASAVASASAALEIAVTGTVLSSPPVTATASASALLSRPEPMALDPASATASARLQPSFWLDPASAVASASAALVQAAPITLAPASATATTAATVTTPVTAVITVTSGPDVAKISKVAGHDLVSFSFQVDNNVSGWEVRAVPSPSSSHTAGAALDDAYGSTGVAGDALAALTPQPVAVRGADLEAASPGDGSKVIKVFAHDALGNWSL